MELLERPLLVLSLRSLLLTLHHDVGRKVRESYGAVRRVDALTSGSAGPHVLPLEIPVGDGDGDLPRLRQHGHAAGARLETVILGSRHWNSLYSVNTRLVFQQSEDLVVGIIRGYFNYTLSTKKIYSNTFH